MEDFIENPFVNMQIRNHNGSLVDALNTQQSIPRCMASLLEVLNHDLKEWVDFQITENEITLGEVLYDPRCDWYTRLVVVEGWGPWGYLDDRPEDRQLAATRPVLIIPTDPALPGVTDRFVPVIRDEVLVGWGLVDAGQSTLRYYPLDPSSINSHDNPTTFSIRSLT